MSLETIFCEELDCESELQPLSFDECNPSLAYNEIRKIYIANIGNPLTNWEDLGEWNGRISNTSSNSDAIRQATLVGTLEIEQGERQRIAGGKFAPQPSKYTFGGDIFDNNDTNYTFIRSMACNRTYLLWYETSDGKLYGGNDGIEVLLFGSEPITDDPETFRTLKIGGEWTSRTPPLRIDSPMAA